VAEYVRVGPEHLLGGAEDVAVGRWTVADGIAAAGRIAGEAIRRATEMAMAGEVDAVVTAPIDKSAFTPAGGTTRVTPRCCAASPAFRRSR
jgi:4-hydroxythreonine-4-phosphate dehydrogenase